MVDVIVEFNQAPAKVEVAKQAVKGKRMSLSSAKEKAESEHDTFKKEWKKVKKLNRPDDEKMDDALGEEGWFHHQRESWAWMEDRFVPYPVQKNIRYLSKESTWKCWLWISI